MPGIANDGSEDLPNIISNDTKHFGICPFCYKSAISMDKDMHGTCACKSGHEWPSHMSLLAVPAVAHPRKAPPEHCVYGACPTCGEPGIKRARDGIGTTWCKNRHDWLASESIVKSEQKPVAMEQKPMYDAPQAENVKLTEHIKRVITEAAHQAREDAGYAGRWDDGGASEKMERLKYWLDGITYATTGITSVYKTIATDFKNSTDPEYLTWVRLQEKFGK